MELKGECWLWARAIDSHGYGAMWHDGGMRKAHRVIYEALVGQIPDGLVLDHLCRTSRCINPDHLEPVTHYENLHREARYYRQIRTHCTNGHEFCEQNTYWHPSGARLCRDCMRKSALKSMLKRKRLAVGA